MYLTLSTFPLVCILINLDLSTQDSCLKRKFGNNEYFCLCVVYTTPYICWWLFEKVTS